MSKNAAPSNRNGSDIWICSQCKTFFDTKRKLLTHLEGTCKLNSTEIRLRDLKYNRISVLGPKSIQRTGRESLPGQTAVAAASAATSGDDRSSDSSLNQQETSDEVTSREQRKREKVTIYEEINESLYKWFLQAKRDKLHLSGPILQEKAKEIAKQLGVSEFKASNGWLHGFKKRNRIAFNRTGFPIPIDSANSDSQSSDEQETLSSSAAAATAANNTIYTDQVENLRMYNLRPVNPNLHLKLKKDEFNNYSIAENGDTKPPIASISLTSLNSSNGRQQQQQQHNHSLPASITLSASSASSANQTRRPDKLIIVHSTPSSASTVTTSTQSSSSLSSATSAPHKLLSNLFVNGSEKGTFATVTSQLLKYSTNKDLPQIKYYGSLRNNSNFSKQLIIMNGSSGGAGAGAGVSASTAATADQSDVTKAKSVLANQNQVQLGKRPLPNPVSSGFCPRILPKSTRLQQQLYQQQQQHQQSSSLNGTKNSTLIDISSDEDLNSAIEIKKEHKPPSLVAGAIAAATATATVPGPVQYGIPIIDFGDEETVRKCFQNGIKSFMPLKGLNIKDKSDLYLPILQIQDIEKRNFIPTNRYLSIGTLKTFTK